MLRMAHISGKLTAKRVASETKAGRHNDGNGLYLWVKESGAKSWILRTRIRGKQTDLGLGGTSYVTLQSAREEAMRLRSMARNGVDPRIERARIIPTYAELAEKVHSEVAPTFRNIKHAAQVITTQRTYAYPIIGEMTFDEITSADIHKVLSPIWLDKHETATRVMQRMNVVFNRAKAEKYMREENPVQVLKDLRILPKVKKKTKHFWALPYKDASSFYAELCQGDGTTALALRFTMLCATRTGETRFAEWDEIDGNDWVIPAHRTKVDNEHRIPLSSEALKVLEMVKGRSERLIFEGAKRDKDMSDGTMIKLGKKLAGKEFTSHGLRSCFRDWAADIAKARFEVAEEALAHKYKTSVQASYLRSDLFDERKVLMESWAQYITGQEAKVVKIA
jgi:integrase